MTSLGLFKFAGISGWGEIEAEDSEIAGVGTVTGDYCTASDDFEGAVTGFASQLYGQAVAYRAEVNNWTVAGFQHGLPLPRDFTNPTGTLSGPHVICISTATGNRQWDLDGCLAEWRNTSGAWFVYYPAGATGIGTSEFYISFPYEDDPTVDTQSQTIFQGGQSPATTPSTYFTVELGIAVADDVFYTTP